MKPHLFKTYVRAEARTLQKPELSRSLFSPLGQRRLDRALARLRPLLGGPHAGALRFRVLGRTLQGFCLG